MNPHEDVATAAAATFFFLGRDATALHVRAAWMPVARRVYEWYGGPEWRRGLGAVALGLHARNDVEHGRQGCSFWLRNYSAQQLDIPRNASCCNIACLKLPWALKLPYLPILLLSIAPLFTMALNGTSANSISQNPAGDVPNDGTGASTAPAADSAPP